MKPLAKTLTHALAALGLAGAAISPALAGDIQKTTIRVSTSDIDLGTAKGQKILERRLERAAQEVCEINSVQTGTRIRSADSIECLKQARAASSTRMAAIIDARVGKGG